MKLTFTEFQVSSWILVWEIHDVYLVQGNNKISTILVWSRRIVCKIIACLNITCLDFRICLAEIHNIIVRSLYDIEIYYAQPFPHVRSYNYWTRLSINSLTIIADSKFEHSFNFNIRLSHSGV